VGARALGLSNMAASPEDRTFGSGVDEHFEPAGASGFFASYAAVTLLFSSIAPFLPELIGGFKGWVSPMAALCVVPGVVERSWRKIGLGAVLGPLLQFFIVTTVAELLIINPEDMPSTVYAVPFVTILSPWRDNILLGPEWRATLVLFSFFFVADVLVIVLRKGGGSWRRAVVALVVSYIPAFVFYRLSWFDTAHWPWGVSDGTAWRGALAWSCYALAYPAKYMTMHYLLDPKGFWRQPRAACIRAASR